MFTPKSTPTAGTGRRQPSRRGAKKDPVVEISDEEEGANKTAKSAKVNARAAKKAKKNSGGVIATAKTTSVKVTTRGAKKAKTGTGGASGGKGRSRSGSDTSDTAPASSDDDDGDARTPKPIPHRGVYPTLSLADLAKAKKTYDVGTGATQDDLIEKIKKYDKKAVDDEKFMPTTDMMLAILVYHES